jgi:hypothetical protein
MSFMSFFMGGMRAERIKSHRVRMSYAYDGVWYVCFQRDGDRNMLPRRLTFFDPGKIIEMHIRWGETKTSAEVHILERNLMRWSPGSVWLVLSEEQYRRLL